MILDINSKLLKQENVFLSIHFMNFPMDARGEVVQLNFYQFTAKEIRKERLILFNGDINRR
jgi:hypothetical protein